MPVCVQLVLEPGMRLPLLLHPCTSSSTRAQQLSVVVQDSWGCCRAVVTAPTLLLLRVLQAAQPVGQLHLRSSTGSDNKAKATQQGSVSCDS